VYWKSILHFVILWVTFSVPASNYRGEMTPVMLIRLPIFDMRDFDVCPHLWAEGFLQLLANLTRKYDSFILKTLLSHQLTLTWRAPIPIHVA
jgi:hypothetical protein